LGNENISFLELIFDALNRQDNLMIIMAIYLALAVLLLFLRIVAHMHYRGALLAFQREARKEIKEKSDISKIKNGLLRKIIAEYIRIAERAVTTVPTAHIVNRHISKMTFLGWSYESIMPLVKSLETGMLLIGLILAFVFSSYAFVYGTLAVIVFLILKLFGAFCDATRAKIELSDDILIYVEREIGRFFAADAGGAILRLKNDLAESISKQTIAYKENMKEISDVMTSTITKVSETMTEAATSIRPAIAAIMDTKLAGVNDTLSSTLVSWEQALNEAIKVQTAMNDSSERISHAGARLQSSSELLATHMQGHSNALSSQLVALVDAINTIKEAVSHFTTQQEALVVQAKYIERNQHVLESSLFAYEESLKGLAQSLGDGLGAFINLHAQTSAQAVNDALKSNLDKVINVLARGGTSE